MIDDLGFQDGREWFRLRAAAIIVEDGKVLFSSNETADYLYSVGGGVKFFERSEEAVKREVFEETGVDYEVERLAFIHENFFVEKDKNGVDRKSHEVAFYYLMKPKGNKNLNSNSFTQGVKEEMVWVDIADLDKVKAFPYFLKEYFDLKTEKVVRIITDEINGTFEIK